MSRSTISLGWCGFAWHSLGKGGLAIRKRYCGRSWKQTRAAIAHFSEQSSSQLPFSIEPHAAVLADEGGADDDGHRRYDDRVGKAHVIIVRLRDQRRGDEWRQSPEHSDAEMIRQRHRGVTDAGRKELDQKSRERPIGHGSE